MIRGGLRTAIEQSSRKNKYGAKRAEYNGVSYDSRAEMRYARDLDIREVAGEILGWERQYCVDLVVHDEHGNARLTLRHRIDFRILHLDGTYELVEIKGVATRDWQLRRKLLEALWLPAHPDHRYTVVRRGR